MQRNIVVEFLNEPLPDERVVEIVERKGLGHPDTLIDGIMEEISINLSNYYLDEIGVILHHNVDKGLIVGGQSKPEFNGGKITYPIEVILAGRATASYSDGNKSLEIPVHSIAISTARKFLKENTRFLDIDNDVIYSTKILEGSADLKSVCDHKHKVPLANDTSFGIGYAPFTDLEKMTKQIEKYLNSKEFKSRFPYVGEDIKVMSLRERNKIKITIACAFVSKFISSLDDYFDKKQRVVDELMKFLKKYQNNYEIELFLNTADNKQNKVCYLTVTGLSCEMGDDGSVGRGNRLSGLITPMRLTTLEAAAGKNPVNHVGKIYSFAAQEIAELIVNDFKDVKGCNVILLSQIGKEIDKPKIADIKISTYHNHKVDQIISKLESSVDSYLESITSITEKLLKKKAGNCYA
ncbi:MAG: methionine adenosyltransferase [Candidatus Micrarchaeota archaeon]|nr:methionine adenosyltransferase [Candidatus Micrarchaeota archaeon]